MNMTPRLPSQRRRGFVLLLFIMSSVAIFPITGLAVDVVLLYFVKARLSAAVDAGALAGARSLSRGGDFAAQKESAIATSLNYFNANFPRGYLLTSRSGPTINVDVNQTMDRTRTVTINATVDAPLYFLRLLRFDRTPVAAMGQTSRRDVNIMLVIDRTGSLETAGACGAVKAATIGFAEKFSEGNDYLGLATFAVASRPDVPATNTNFKQLVRTVMNAMVCSGWTGGAQGLSVGYNELKRLNDPGVLNVILFFTDGQPNTLTANWPIRKNPYYTGAPGSGSNAVSPCTNKDDKLGVITPDSPVRGLWGWVSTGYPRPQDPGVLTTSVYNGCSFRTSGTNTVNLDVSYIPDYDYYGNYTRTGWGGNPTLNNTNHQSHNYPPVGRKIALNPSNVERASINALDNAAIRIRNDATLNPVIYSVGFGDVVDALLRRVANDPLADNYDRTKQTGMYIFSPTADGISLAFSRIAAEILRISM
jgi:Mg-chelatase subunit ChlD